MNSLQNIYKWASGCIALVPGFAVILTDLGTPPSISKIIYGGVVEAFGALTFLLLFLNKQYIMNIPARKVNRISITMLIVFFISLLLYILLYNSQVVYSSKYDSKLFFPFWYRGDLQYMISEAGSKLNAIINYGPQSVSDAIANSQPYLELTSVLFTLLYLTIFESLIICFGLPGFKATNVSLPTDTPEVAT